MIQKANTTEVNGIATEIVAIECTYYLCSHIETKQLAYIGQGKIQKQPTLNPENWFWVDCEFMKWTHSPPIDCRREVTFNELLKWDEYQPKS